MEKLTGIFLKVFAFFTALCFLLTLGGKLISPHVTSTVINQRVLGEIRTEYICEMLAGCTFLALLFFGAGLGLMMFILYGPKEYAQMGFRSVACCTMLGIVGLGFFIMGVARVVPVVGDEPQIVAVTVVDKSTRLGAGRHARIHHDLEFSNGTQRSVGEGVYYETDVGDPYYVVMCGHTPISVLNPDEYTVDRSLLDGGA